MLPNRVAIGSVVLSAAGTEGLTVVLILVVRDADVIVVWVGAVANIVAVIVFVAAVRYAVVVEVVVVDRAGGHFEFEGADVAAGALRAGDADPALSFGKRKRR